jgi:hypothetical protein
LWKRRKKCDGSRPTLQSADSRFFSEFFQLFFPTWWERFDFTRVEWLSQEIFTDPPQGERRAVDLVAKLPTRQGVPGQRPDEEESWLALVHIEVESRDSVQPLRSRMYETYEHLRRHYRIPVLPIGLYLRVGLDGLGIDAYEEHFWEFQTIHFQYLYVGLPALDGMDYVSRDNCLGYALAALMRIPEDRKVWLRAEAERRIMQSKENIGRRYLLHECAQAYLSLSESQQRQYEELMMQDPYREVNAMTVAMYDKTRLEGMERGIEKGQRELLLGQLEERFGSLTAEARNRLASWPPEDLPRLGRALIKAQSLRDLGLEG